ncbi:MAG: radical SAM protein [Planctomycetaceae bacterium]|nr:radical SAM protein [Planctomycetaceae bacterium]
MSNVLPQHRFHPRQYDENKFVYPVVSRRSQGVSLGVNLNPDKVCNFDCIYCQVDRRSEAETKFVEMDRLLAELDHMLAFITSGAIWETDRFRDVPEYLRRLNDIAFSGDGEPTTFRNFDDIIEQAAKLKAKFKLAFVKLVLITNASMFHRENVQRGLKKLDENNGEIWAKLDAGTEEYYQQIERTKIPFQRILDNIRDVAIVRPIVIQSLFMQVDGVGPSEQEISAYIQRLNEIVAVGGQIKLVQIYTVARTPAESSVTALPNDAVDQISKQVRQETGLSVSPYFG